MNGALFANLLFTHFLTDFTLQRNQWVQDKIKHGVFCWGFWNHLIVVAIGTYVAIWSYELWWLTLAIVFVHGVVDWAKIKFGKRVQGAFLCDQIIHIAILVCVAYGEGTVFTWSQWPFLTGKWQILAPALVCAYYFCWSPANYLIREVIRDCKIRDTKHNSCSSNDSVKRSGELIGSLERMLVLTFVLVGSFEAAGLTIAAKSLLRFKDDDDLRTEYVLIGTLLSLFLAVLCAVILRLVGLDLVLVKA